MDEHKLTEAVELLKSRDSKKRMAAVDMASELDTVGSTALLIKAIQDQSWSLREHAIKRTALAGHKAVKPLIRLLRDGVWYTRAAAVQALDLIGESSAIPAIVPLVKDPNRSVAEAAGKAVSALALKAGSDAILLMAKGMPDEQRTGLAKVLAGVDAALAKEISGLAGDKVSLAGLPEEPGTADRLQGLRRDIRTVARQGDRSEEDDI